MFLLVFCFSAVLTGLVNRERVKAKNSKRKTVKTAPAAQATATPTPSPTPTPTATPAAAAPASAATSSKKDKKDKKSEISGAGQKANSKDAPPPDMSTLYAPEHSVLSMTGVRCQIHHDGEVRQELSSREGFFDEDAGVMDLNIVKIKFQNQGTTVGTVMCGTGRVWTKDRPKEKLNGSAKEGISTNDMWLRQNVRLQTSDHKLLQSAEMYYQAQETLLSSDKGYLEQMPVGDHYFVGTGHRFELKLRLKSNKFDFEYWRKYGNQAVMKKSDKPVLLP